MVSLQAGQRDDHILQPFVTNQVSSRAPDADAALLYGLVLFIDLPRLGLVIASLHINASVFVLKHVVHIVAGHFIYLIGLFLFDLILFGAIFIICIIKVLIVILDLIRLCLCSGRFRMANDVGEITSIAVITSYLILVLLLTLLSFLALVESFFFLRLSFFYGIGSVFFSFFVSAFLWLIREDLVAAIKWHLDELHGEHEVLVFHAIDFHVARALRVVHKGALGEGHLDSGVFHVLFLQLLEIHQVFYFFYFAELFGLFRVVGFCLFQPKAAAGRSRLLLARWCQVLLMLLVRIFITHSAQLLNFVALLEQLCLFNALLDFVVSSSHAHSF